MIVVLGTTAARRRAIRVVMVVVQSMMMQMATMQIAVMQMMVMQQSAGRGGQKMGCDRDCSCEPPHEHCDVPEATNLAPNDTYRR
ncbi:MAG TPA: hypothetical protein VJ809_02070 [Pirellulales bacterium]|jgi:hypothetical protein|nr:hypothetical protein [Pirellulales bacterium]